MDNFNTSISNCEITLRNNNEKLKSIELVESEEEDEEFMMECPKQVK